MTAAGVPVEGAGAGAGAGAGVGDLLGVGAGAVDLLGEGFVHNRARMVSASFLCKHLLIDYRRGEAHYMKHLTDGDWAQNNAGWQWSAGCGCDAQPYFRIFNPESQATRFDPTAAYIRRWVPEFGTPAHPAPMVDLRESRAAALAAYDMTKNAG